METPAHSRAFGTASAGAIGKSIGSVAASAKPRTRASGVQPSAAALSALIKIIAHAPSFNVDALPAVTVPSFLKTARRLPNLDSLKRVYSSSLVTTVSGYKIFFSRDQGEWVSEGNTSWGEILNFVPCHVFP